MAGTKGMGMEGWLARWYARTRRNDMDEFRRQAGRVAARLAAGAKVLEIAPGPGFFAVELAKLGNFEIVGLDVSRTFVAIATENAAGEGVRVDFRLGNASAMPFADESFDFAYCSAAFKNFSEPVKALDEMHRVLRRGGAALIVDLRKDVSMQDVDAYLKRSGRSAWDAWITGWIFRTLLTRRAYTREQLSGMAGESAFGGCRIEADSIGFEVHLVKPARSAPEAPWGALAAPG